MQTSSKSILPGLILISVGILMLIHKLDLFYFCWTDVYPFIFIGIGVMLLITAQNHKNHSAIFWGTIFTLLGTFFFLRNFGFINYYFISEIWPIFMLIMAIGFITLFIFNPRDWGVLIPATLFLLIGTIFLLRNLHLEEAYDFLIHYWPLLLIIIGVVVIGSNLKKRK